MEQLLFYDKQIFFAINGCHNVLMDYVLWYASLIITWLPFYLFIFVALLKSHKQKAIATLCTVPLMILVTDQTGLFIKETTRRLRPSHNPEMMMHIHLLNDYAGGMYGFVSQHAANTSGLAMFLILVWHKKIKWLAPLMVLYVVLNCYSRIYIGVHYPSDIVAGVMIGCAASVLFYYIFNIFCKKYLPSII